MNIQKVTKDDAEKRLKDHRGWMRGWLVKHALMVKLERSCRIGNDFAKDFVKAKMGLGTKLLVSQDKAQAHMDRHAVWITIYLRLLRVFESGEQEAQTVVGGLCDGCKQPHRDLTERDEEYYCPECLDGEADDDEFRCLVCHNPIPIGKGWRISDGKINCAECYAQR